MADFNKLLQHPECEKIINKLGSGDTPKEVCAYLKHKYSKPDENHLRLSASLLDEFLKSYGSTADFMEKIVRDERAGALDKEIAKSLLNNKSWKERLANVTDEKIDLERKLYEQLYMLEQRQEQIFDKIQENPGNAKLDYVMTKYFELNMVLVEKIEKIVNKAPDQRIEHTYTVQMVEQQAVALQEAIKAVIGRLEPEMASLFMDMLTEEMARLKSPNDIPVQTFDKTKKDVAKFEKKVEKLDEDFEKLDDDINKLEE